MAELTWLLVWSRHIAGDLRRAPSASTWASVRYGSVEGRRDDGGSRLQLRVGLAAGVGVRFDEDGVVEVLEGRRERAGHGQVAQDVRALHKVEGRPAGPGLAVAQGHGQERVRDELVRRGGVAVYSSAAERGRRLRACCVCPQRRTGSSCRSRAGCSGDPWRASCGPC